LNVLPPVQRENAALVSFQVMPPSKDAASIRPCEPPLDQRSCCQAAIRFRGLRGFRARDGSTAASTYRIPFAATPSQPALKVESCDTRTCVTEVKGGGGGGGGALPPHRHRTLWPAPGRRA